MDVLERIDADGVQEAGAGRDDDQNVTVDRAGALQFLEHETWRPLRQRRRAEPSVDPDRFDGTAAVEAVEVVDRRVRGSIFGIVGHNGAGNTTTVEILQGLRRPDGGKLSVLGLDPQRDVAEIRQRVCT